MATMILDDNGSGESLTITTAEQLATVLAAKLAARADFSLALDAHHFVQAMPDGGEDGSADLWRVGYKDRKGNRGYVATLPCSREEARRFVADYFANSVVPTEGFEWDAIATGPMWVPYAFPILAGVVTTIDAWSRDQMRVAYVVWAAVLAIIGVTYLVARRRRPRHRGR